MLSKFNCNTLGWKSVPSQIHIWSTLKLCKIWKWIFTSICLHYHRPTKPSIIVPLVFELEK